MVITSAGIALAIRELQSSIFFRRIAAAEYSRMGRDEVEKAFEKDRADRATQDADQLQEVVNFLQRKPEEQSHVTQTA